MGRELQTLNGQNKLALWAGRISECRNSGQNVKTWCRENGICEQTYYKWQRRLFEMAQAQQEVSFAEVTPLQAVHSGKVAVLFIFPELRRISIPVRMRPPWKRCCGY